VTDARSDLTALLETAGLPVVAPSGGMTPPCVFIVPSDPWVEPSMLKLHGRSVRFDIVAIVGSASDPALVAACDLMAEAISTAIAGRASTYVWTLPSVSAPSAYEAGGNTYMSVRGTAETSI
jgi:hypothetical protein